MKPFFQLCIFKLQIYPACNLKNNYTLYGKYRHGKQRAPYHMLTLLSQKEREKRERKGKWKGKEMKGKGKRKKGKRKKERRKKQSANSNLKKSICEYK